MACEPRVACEPRSEWFRPSRLRKNHPLRPRRGRPPTHIGVPARRGRSGLLQGSARRENHPPWACGGNLPPTSNLRRHLVRSHCHLCAGSLWRVPLFAREARGGFLSSAQSDPSAGLRRPAGLAFGGEGVQDGPCSGIHASRHGHAANPRAAHAVAPGMARQAFRQGERDGSPRPQGGAPWTSVLVTVDHAISERGCLLAPLPRRV